MYMNVYIGRRELEKIRQEVQETILRVQVGRQREAEVEKAKMEARNMLQ